MSTSIDRLAAKIAGLEKKVKALGTQPQLAYSSIEDGNVNEYDAEGQISSRTGAQHDGTHGSFTLAGPDPPTPTAPVVVPMLGGLRVRWDGFYEGGETVPPPMDFARVEIHASTEVGFAPDTAATLYDTFETSRGGEKVLALAPGDYEVALVARALSGKRSLSSVHTTGTPISIEGVGAGTTVFYGATEPTTAVEGDLWYADVGGGQFVPRRYTGGVWVDLPSSEADAALAAALAAQATANSKNVIYRQDAEPTGGTYIAGDIWIDSNDGNRIYRYDGAAFVSAQLGGGAIATAGIADTHIASLSATKITAGVISANLTVSGSIATALSGARVSLDATGLRAFDSTGANTVLISSTGTAILTGRVQSGGTGARVTVGPGSVNNTPGEGNAGDGSYGQSVIRLYTGATTAPAEEYPSELAADFDPGVGTNISATWLSPTRVGWSQAVGQPVGKYRSKIRLFGADPSNFSRAEVHAQDIWLYGEVQIPAEYHLFVAGYASIADRLIIAGREQGRGRVVNGWAPATAAVSIGSTGAESEVILTNVMVFPVGRAFRISVKGIVQGTAASTGRIRIHKGLTTAGAVWADFHEIFINGSTSTSVGFHQEAIVINATGAEISTALCMTLERNSGTGTMTLAASTSQVAYIFVEDIGIASEYASAQEIS